jgi:dolichol kinase
MDFFNELRRKIFHLLGGMIIPVGILFFSDDNFYIAQLIIAFCTVGVLIIDIIRINNPTIKNIFLGLFRDLIREHEYTNLTGSTYLLFSSLICVYFFDRQIASAALAFLAIGDTMAALVGRSIGKIKIFGEKSVAGTLACFISCFLIGWLMPEIPMLPAILGALTATLVEVIPIPLDDNIRIPISAAMVMTLLR